MIVVEEQAVVDRIVDEEIRPAVPGAAVAVLRNGEPIAVSTVGYADLSWRQPVTRTTRFRIGSITKPMTAACVRGVGIELDRPIADYVPAYENAVPKVRHLLSHTSGIPNFVTMPGFFGGAARIDHDDEGLIALFAGDPLH